MKYIVSALTLIVLAVNTLVAQNTPLIHLKANRTANNKSSVQFFKNTRLTGKTEITPHSIVYSRLKAYLNEGIEFKVPTTPVGSFTVGVKTFDNKELLFKFVNATIQVLIEGTVAATTTYDATKPVFRIERDRDGLIFSMNAPVNSPTSLTVLASKAFPFTLSDLSVQLTSIDAGVLSASIIDLRTINGIVTTQPILPSSKWSPNDPHFLEPTITDKLPNARTQLKVGSTIKLIDRRLSNQEARHISATLAVNNAIILEINEGSLVKMPKNFTYTLDLEITSKDISGATYITKPRMTIAYDSANAITGLREIINLQGRHQLVIKVMKVTYNGISYTNNIAAIPDIFTLYANTEIERVMNFNCSNTPVTSLRHKEESFTHTSKMDRLNVLWENVNAANEYDVEWTFYDDRSAVLEDNDLQTDFDFLFKDNATRITTTQFIYPITLIYSKGRLFYRVRAVHYEANGQRTVGLWTSNVTTATNVAGFPNQYAVEGHDEAWNWQTQQVFAEEGKQTQSLKYFDASLRERQTQALSNAESTVVVGETIYDSQGRPVLKVMPAPMPNAALGYVNGLSKNTTGQDYSRADFIDPTNDCADNVKPMSAPLSKGAAHYFSDKNPLASDKANQFTPDAQQYPFSITEFMPDATGRIRRQSGVGEPFKLGNGHETQYFYAKPAQEELDRLFGTDVGDNTAYLKNMVIDGNGQASVSYIDAHGRTIATALAGETTDNLNKVDNQPTNPDMMTKDLLNNVVLGNALVSSYVLDVHTEGVHTLQYILKEANLKFQKMCDNNKNVCYACVYDLELSVTSDNCNFIPFSHTEPNVNQRTNCLASNDPAQYLKEWTNGNVKLPRGTYQITKRLTVSQQAKEKSWNAFKAESDCVKTLASFIKEAIDTLTYLDCKDTTEVDFCAECRNGKTYPAFEAEYIIKCPKPCTTTVTVNDKGITETKTVCQDTAQYNAQIRQAYTDYINRCRLNCSDECSILFQSLLSDVSPNGQYGVTYSETTKRYTLTKASVFLGFNNSSHLYLNAEGCPSTVMVNGVLVKPNTLSLTDFVQHWQPSWAHELVKSHPEYCYFEWCSRPDREPWFVFEDTLRLQNDYRIYTELPLATLQNLPLSINPSSATMPRSDPFSTAMLSPAMATERAKIKFTTALDPAQTQFNIFKAAKAIAYCNASNETATSMDCIPDEQAGRTGCVANDRRFWQILRTMYLANRRHLIYRIRDEELTDFCKTNVAKIGTCQKSADLSGNNPISPLVDCEVNCTEPLGCKVRRVFLPKDVPSGVTFPLDVDAEKRKTEDMMKEGFQQNCEGLADLWLEKLTCLKFESNEQKKEVRQHFIDICMGGSDIDHPNGATSINPNLPDSGNPRSVEEVLKKYFDNQIGCNDCNATLIQTPGLYGQQYLGPKQIDRFTREQTPICDKLAEIRVLYERDLGRHGFTKFIDFFNALSVVQLNAEEFSLLEAACPITPNNCALLDGAMNLPPQLDGNRCKTCEDMNILVDEYHTTVCNLNDEPIFHWELEELTPKKDPTRLGPQPIDPPRGLTAQMANQQLSRLTRWLNYKTGMNLDDNEYTWFFNQCRNQRSASTSNGRFDNIRNHLKIIAKEYTEEQNAHITDAPYMICPRPQTLEEEIIDSSCYYKQQQHAINDAHLRYDAYIDSLKNAFYNGYNATCLRQADLNETFTDEGPSKEYHYTLYYYDQAGNLVQTVPPAGVKPLGGCEITQLKKKQKGLVAYYPFKEDLRDYSGSGLDLGPNSNSGRPDFDPVLPTGEGLQLTPNTSYVSDITDILDNDKHTVAFFIKFPTTDLDEWAKIFGYCPTGTNRSPGIFQYPNTSKLHWRYSSATVSNDGLSGTSENRIFTKNKWHHVATVKDNGVLSYYIDGVLIAADPVSTVKTSGQSPLYFGAFQGQAAGNVAIKEFKIFNRPLLACEISALVPRDVTPAHALKTQYWYNSLNQVVKQTSPDGGKSFFWYDYLGRLVLSQNANQLTAATVSYTFFDKLGRTVEVGQGKWATPPFPPYSAVNTDDDTYYTRVDAFVKGLKAPKDFNTNGSFFRTSVTRTYYDKAPPLDATFITFKGENLRNRVAVVAVYRSYEYDYTDPTDACFACGDLTMSTYYTYDVAGNVKTLVHDFPELRDDKYISNGLSKSNRYKRLDYVYDLVSGKVNKLYYQRDDPDQFIYRYDYDADNRLTKAYSSTDGFKWVMEAAYKYYKHGPLSRIELGREYKKVQGMDYAYTLQGWIKGVNASFLDPNKDIGRDGAGASRIRKDAFAYTIGYFDGDYKPIGGDAVKFDVRTDDTQPLAATSAYVKKGLFNGNIRYIASDNEKFSKPLLMTYDYDQLNRINKMESWQDKLNKTTSFTWTRTTPDTKWREDIKYDPNGNILTYKRNDEKGDVIDDLTYKYSKDANGQLVHNRLNAVHDAAAASPSYADDIEGGEDDNAFIYDEIGNLTYDNKQNTHFIWSVYGKMSSAKKVVNSTKTTVSEFGYDAQQNRYKKDNYSILTNRFAHTITQTHDVNYYIRDAQGNVLAIYNKQHNAYYNTETGENSQQTYHLNQKEQHLYGSSRLGIVQLDRQMSMMSWSGADLITQNQGIRNYELTNHLGNVLSTITDKGVITSAQDYYPFGLTLASRSFTEGGSAYRFGFNGKENDKELKQQDYGARISRPDLGRFLSVDPISKLYAELTPYQFASNCPMLYVDLEGLEAAKKKIPLNVVIVVPSAVELEHPVKPGWHGGWFYIVKKDLIEVAKALEDYDGKINNLIIDNHGGKVGGTMQYNSNGKAIEPNNIEKYPDNKSKEAKDVISALITIGEKVKKGGNCVILACNFVKGDDGKLMFSKVHFLWKKELNVYASDRFNMGTIDEQQTNPISSVVTFERTYESFYKLPALDSVIKVPYNIYFFRDKKEGTPNLKITEPVEKPKKKKKG